MSAAIAEVVAAGNVSELALAAKRAGRKLASLSTDKKNQILLQIAESLERHAAEVLAANAEDAAEAAKACRSRRDVEGFVSAAVTISGKVSGE